MVWMDSCEKLGGDGRRHTAGDGKGETWGGSSSGVSLLENHLAGAIASTSGYLFAQFPYGNLRRAAHNQRASFVRAKGGRVASSIPSFPPSLPPSLRRLISRSRLACCCFSGRQ